MENTLACAALVALGLAIAFLIATHLQSRAILIRKHVVVNLLDDQAITGVLWRRHMELVVLKSAELVQPGREPVRMDGDVIVERKRINWIQVLGA